jgi:glycosyltransferase involved in cell wall biosynthesis
LWRNTTPAEALRQWLAASAEQIDCVCSSGLGDEAATTLSWAAKQDVPVFVRVDDADVASRDASRDRLFQSAAALITPTESTAEKLVDGGFPRERISVVAPGVTDLGPKAAETKAAARAALAELDPLRGMPDHAPLALCLASRSAAEGLEKIVGAWPAIIGRWPNARLWIVGQGPWRDALARQVESLRLAGRVVVPGAFENVRELLLAADLFVHPASGAGLSIALLEAMAAGLPVIANEAAGRDVIEANQHGLLVPEADRDALAAAITRLIDRPDEAQRMGQAAAELASRRYSVETMAADHLRLFQSLANADRTHPPHGVGPPKAKQRIHDSSDRQRAQ